MCATVYTGVTDPSSYPLSYVFTYQVVGNAISGQTVVKNIDPRTFANVVLGVGMF